MNLDDYKVRLIDAVLRGEDLYLIMFGNQRWIEAGESAGSTFFKYMKPMKATKRSLHVIRRPLTLKRAIAIVKENYVGR